jgi:head-tail adaptor
MPKQYPGLRAGQLRDLMELQERVDSLDAANAPLPPSWRMICRLWADVKQLQGFRQTEIEAPHAQQLMASSAYKVTVRFRSDVTAKHRLLWIGPPDMSMNILSVADPDGRRRRLVLICQAGLVDG